MGLNRRQLRAISIAIVRYQQFLIAFEPVLHQWLAQPSEDTALILQRLLESVSKAQAILEQTSRTLGLRFHSPDLHMWALAQVTSLWTTLEDLHPDKLRRYGDVDEQAVSEWEAQLSELKAVTGDLMSSLETLVALERRS